MVEEYFIGVKVNGNFSKEIIETRNKLVNERVIKYKKRYFPHITLYPQGFDDEDELLENFNFNLKKIPLLLDCLEVFRGRKINEMKDILHFKVRLTNPLIKIHKIILEKFSKIRNDVLQKIVMHYRDDLIADEIEMTEKYGYPFVDNLFNPHITISSFKDKSKLSRAMDEFSKIKIPTDLKVDSISLFKKDKANDVWMEIKEANLR